MNEALRLRVMILCLGLLLFSNHEVLACLLLGLLINYYLLLASYIVLVEQQLKHLLIHQRVRFLVIGIELYVA